MDNGISKVEESKIGTGDGDRIMRKNTVEKSCPNEKGLLSAQELRVQTQQLSLREQLELNHFLLERLYAASAGLIQALNEGDVHTAIGEILGNLIGCEEAALFHYDQESRRFAQAWSVGVSDDTLQQFDKGTGMMWRTVGESLTQFRDRQNESHLQLCEQNLTASVVLKSSSEVVGVILLFGLLPQKNGFEWVDYQILKFLETYGAVAIQLQSLRKNAVTP
jgi:hypothetical protein